MNCIVAAAAHYSLRFLCIVETQIEDKQSYVFQMSDHTDLHRAEGWDFIVSKIFKTI